MARLSGLRPRTLSIAFGVLFLLMVIISYWFATGPGSGYKYGVDVTRTTLLAYLVAAAAILVGMSVMAVGQMRALDRKIEEAEDEGGVETIVEEVVAMESSADPEGTSEDLPPPLKEAPESKDHVDQDIDELLVSLQEMETATEEAVEEAVAPEPAPEVKTAPTRKVFPEADRKTAARLQGLKHRRAALPSYFAGPVIASVGVVAVTAALLPGSDVMLQSYFQLDTAVLLGIGYSFGFIALYAALTVYAILRAK